ncbi:MAG: zinc ABC transporter substrate-binding protein [Deltaproteobacteria bacterium]|jgi:zinc transport system substrate-binding protein|nr:zinc ABC transporter substrate-binding protein [Deltaproteobacteria bacterium]MBW2571436.1 zinc ABC transporter substrate-binding protein [Deltaproteobacteria bacterium]MBW2671663.1 zinc ABC transporter substrate-binding protein [Deltaproteobacteria bacterium]
MKTLESAALKSKTFFFCTLFVLIHIVALPGISYSGTDVPRKLTIYVVNYPLKYFAERIAVDRAKVVFPGPSEGDPAYWMPDAETVAAYQKADLILLNGANYAKWVRKVSLPRSKMVDTSAKFKDRYITAEEVVTHSHGAEGSHAHESLAFTTWLDFDLAAKQAREIMEILSRKKPEAKDFFEKNYTALEHDLLSLDSKMKNIAAKNPSSLLVASHPVYDYLSRRYGLNIKSVHWEPDEFPSDAQWSELRAMLKKHSAKWMIWEGKPMKESAERLKAVGVNSLVFDPCGNIPDQGDFMSVMRRNGKNLESAFQ